MLLEHGAKVRLPAAVALNRTADVEMLLRSDPGTPEARRTMGQFDCSRQRVRARRCDRDADPKRRAVNVHDDPKTSIDSTERLYTSACGGVARELERDRRVDEARRRCPRPRREVSRNSRRMGRLCRAKEARDLILRGLDRHHRGDPIRHSRTRQSRPGRRPRSARPGFGRLRAVSRGR